MSKQIQMSLEEKVNALQSSEISAGLSNEQLKKVAGLGHAVYMDSGSVLTEHDTTGYEAFLLVKGGVEVQLRMYDDPTQMQNTCKLTSGAIIGEMSILEDEQRCARTVACEPSVLLTFRGTDLWTLFEENPLIGYYFMKNLAKLLSRRLRYTNIGIRYRFFEEEI